MKSIMQILRQPGKSLSGLILSALAAAILVVSAGQYSATVLTRANLDDRYDTLALVSDEYFWEQEGDTNTYHVTLPEEYRQWAADVIRSRPDLVEGEAYSGGLSAYIPELAPDNFSRHEEGFYGDGYNDGNPYRCAVLEVTLTGIETTPHEDASYFKADDLEEPVKVRRSISLLCTGRIDRVIGLEQGFEPPEGKTIALNVIVCDEEALDALQLNAGQRCLVYGMDYSDVQGRDMNGLILTWQDAFQELFGFGLSKEEIADRLDCFMTVCDYSSLPASGPDGQGQFVTFTAERRNYDKLSGVDGGYHYEYVPAEEYIPHYRVPTMTKLEGEAEEYLSSEEGKLWRQALEEMEISNHGFPVLAVDKLGYQAAFARGQARIVEGRDFTERERTDGSRVCILSQSLAAANGLQVGDTVDLRYYGYDYNINAQRQSMDRTSPPGAAIYSRAAGFLTETEGYTVVGLYRQNNAWQNANDPYGFTPNTLFVPKASVTCEMWMRRSGVFYSLVLQNGKLAEFEKLQEEVGYPGLFICTDQGYSQIVSALDDYESVSVNAFWVGIAAAGAVMVLLLILFPLQQGKTVAVMHSLGAGRGEKIRHVLAGSAGVLIPGGILGGIIGALLWGRVTAGLMESVNVEIPLEANTPVTAAVLTAAYVLFMLAAVLAAALPVTREKGLRKGK